MGLYCFLKKWKITSMKAKYTFNNQQKEDDVFNEVFEEACDRDNLSVLFSNKKYEAREGATKCDNNNDLLDSGTWELKNNDTELHITTAKTGTLYSTLKEVTETSITTEFPSDFVYEVGDQKYPISAVVTAIYTAQ